MLALCSGQENAEDDGVESCKPSSASSGFEEEKKKSFEKAVDALCLFRFSVLAGSAPLLLM